jgi:putative toxin-antitoxin system antitoxin component (TIGR02293 family)
MTLRKRAAARARRSGVTFGRMVAAPLPPEVAIETVRRGIPARALEEAETYLDLSRKELLDVLRIPASTFHRRLAGNETLSPSETEKLVRLGEITRKAEETFGSPEAARAWLRTDNTLLGGTPLSLLDTEAGAAQVKRVLGTLDFGGTA